MRLLAVAGAAVAALALAFSSAAVAASAHPRPSESDLETLLVCPTCHETLDESNSAAAQQMKDEIRRRIAQGWTKKQILDEMVANYGPGVLSTPATHGFDLLAWLLPIGGVGAGAVALGGGAWYWTRPGRRDVAADGEDEGEPLDPESAQLVDDELARFDP